MQRPAVEVCVSKKTWGYECWRRSCRRTHVLQLTRLPTDLTCPVCKETGLSITVSEGENAGFASQLLLTCDGCGDYEKKELSSPRMQDSDSKNIAFEVNPMMVLFSHEVGGSYAVLETFSAVVGIPAMHLKTYQRHDKKVTGWCLAVLSLFNLLAHCGK